MTAALEPRPWRLAKYDPSQPRDPKGTDTGGRWASTGGRERLVRGKPGTRPFLQRDALDELCRELGLDPKTVTVLEGTPPQGRSGDYVGIVAGRYVPKTRRIEIYARAFTSEGEVRRVLVHEGSHARFAVAMKSAKVKTFLKDNFQALAREDGVTPYSRGHWQAFEARDDLWEGRSPLWSRAIPVDETMAAIREHRRRPPRTYARLLRLVEAHA